MSRSLKNNQFWSRGRRLWLLLAVIAMVAAACGATVDSVTDAASDDAAEAFEAADAAGDVADVVTGDDDAEAFADSDAADDDDGGDDGGRAAPSQAPVEGTPLGASGSTTAAQTTSELGREIIFTADVTVRVDNVTATGRQATEVISDLGGFVFGEESQGGNEPRTTLIFKVRPDDFSEALESLAGIGELRSQRITTDDVTERVVDLQGRIDTTALGVERLRTAMEAATNLEDFARLEQQLLNRESDLAVLRGTLRTLRDRIDLATITLTIVQDRVQNGIEVSTSRYEGHDGGIGCPGNGGNPIEPGDAVTVCFELVNTGDQTLTDVSLTDTVLGIDEDDLTVVFGDADDLQPGQALMLALDLTPERTQNLRVTVAGTPTTGVDGDAAGPVVRTTLTPRIGVDRSSVSAGFTDGFDSATALLARLWTITQVLVGFVLPLLILLPFAWLGLRALRALRGRRSNEEESGDIDGDEGSVEFQPPPPTPSVAGA